MTPSGIEPATIRLAAQWPNQLRYRVPPPPMSLKCILILNCIDLSIKSNKLRILLTNIHSLETNCLWVLLQQV